MVDIHQESIEDTNYETPCSIPYHSLHPHTPWFYGTLVYTDVNGSANDRFTEGSLGNKRTPENANNNLLCLVLVSLEFLWIP